MRVLGLSGWYGLAMLASAGCYHGGSPAQSVTPLAATQSEAPVINGWVRGQPAPAWPTGPAGTNLQVRVWTGTDNCQGTPPTPEQLAAAPSSSYLSLAIGGAVAIAPKDNPRDATYVQSGNRGVAETTLAPGRYYLTISNHTCLVDLTVPSEAGAPFVIQPLPDPTIDQRMPGVAVDTSTGVVHIDVTPSLVSSIPMCS